MMTSLVRVRRSDGSTEIWEINGPPPNITATVTESNSTTITGIDVTPQQVWYTELLPEFPHKVDPTLSYRKGKAFKFASSREFREWFNAPPAHRSGHNARYGFQQMARIPNYRSVRTR